MLGNRDRRSVYVSQGATVSQVQEAVNSVLPSLGREFAVTAVVEAADEYSGYDVVVHFYGTEHAIEPELRDIASALRGMLWKHKFAIDFDLENRNAPMLISFVYPDFRRGASGSREDGLESDCVALFFVECLESTAVELIERFNHGDRHVSEKDATGSGPIPIGAPHKPLPLPRHSGMARVPVHRPGDSERVGFRVARDLSLIDRQVLHHPYHQLYNAYSPWWALPRTRVISDLAELVDVELVAGMIPLGIVGEGYWTPPDWKEDD